MKRLWIWLLTQRRADLIAIVFGIVVVGGAPALWGTGYLVRL